MPDVISFGEAIEESRKYSKRLLMLGNGFSISCFPDIFRYGTLYEQADFSKTPEIPKVFEQLGTRDFEEVIKALDEVVKVAPLYGGADDASIQKMKNHSKELKNILVKTIANHHPAFPAAIPEANMQACREFLANFVSGTTNGKIYSLNYDLLLYWVLMHEDEEPLKTGLVLKKNDGFGRDEETIVTDYVIWHGETKANEQSIYYIHGALHLFDAGKQLQKYTWVKTNIRLIEQTRSALDEEKYPLFVAEGTSDSKLTKIQHSAYLHHAFKSFTTEVGSSNKCLFIHGHSLAESDRHILQKIAQGKVAELYIGLHGRAEKDSNRSIIETAEALVQQRSDKFPLKLRFYDAVSAKVWG